MKYQPIGIEGDLVAHKDTPERWGTVKLDANTNLIVVFKTPKQPKKKGFCDRCGWPGMLSANGATGEIVCMASGCGHDHGFDENEEKIPLLDSIVHPDIEARKKFTNHLLSLTDDSTGKEFLEGHTFLIDFFSSIPNDKGREMKVDFVGLLDYLVNNNPLEKQRISFLRTFIRGYKELIESVAPKGWTASAFLDYMEECLKTEAV